MTFDEYQHAKVKNDHAVAKEKDSKSKKGFPFVKWPAARKNEDHFQSQLSLRGNY